MEKQILAKNNCGCVSYCAQENIFSVAIGNIFVNFDAKTLSNFLNALNDSKKALCHQKCCFNKVFIESPIKNFYLTFTERELDSCIDLLNEALFMQNMQTILEENKIIKN